MFILPTIEIVQTCNRILSKPQRVYEQNEYLLLCYNFVNIDDNFIIMGISSICAYFWFL
jgi:hypothetical protein